MSSSSVNPNSSLDSLFTNIEQLTGCPVCFEPYTMGSSPSTALLAIQEACSHITCAVCKPTLEKCPICRDDWDMEKTTPNSPYTQIAEKTSALSVALQGKISETQQLQEDLDRVQAQKGLLEEQTAGQSQHVDQQQLIIARLRQKKVTLKEQQANLTQQLHEQNTEYSRLLQEALQSSPQVEQNLTPPASAEIQVEPSGNSEVVEDFISTLEYRLQATASERDATVQANTKLSEKNRRLKRENEELSQLVETLIRQGGTLSSSYAATSSSQALAPSITPEVFDPDDPKHLYHDIKNSLLFRETRTEAQEDAIKHLGIRFFCPSQTIPEVITCLYYEANELRVINLIKTNLNASDVAIHFNASNQKYNTWLMNS